MAMTEWSIVGPAFLAGVLVLASHIPLGRQVLARGIIFVDLAVAQAAATGLLAGRHWLELQGLWSAQLCALLAALACVLFLHWLERFGGRVQEALIGGTFVFLASASVLLVASDPHGGEHLSSALSGQILWVNNTQLGLLAAAAVFTLVCGRLFRHPLPAFYIPFSIAITASVQAIGVYLVFASLIFPALAALRLTGTRAVGVALGSGIAGYLAGLAASVALDLPSGPAVVVALALAAVAGHRISRFAQWN